MRVVPGDYSGAPGNGTSSDSNNNSSAANSTSDGGDNAESHSNTGFNYVLSEMDQAGMTGTTLNTAPAAESNNADQQQQQQQQGSSAIDAFPQAIQTLQAQLDQQASPDQIKTQWNSFLENLAAQYPNSASSIKELEDATANYSTAKEWQHLVQVLENETGSAPTPSSSSSQQQQQQQQSVAPSETLPSHSNQATW